MADCAVCSQPILDTAYVDDECAGRLAGWLRDAADLAPELDTVLAKQARYADPGPRPRNSAPAESVRLGLVADPGADHAAGPAGGLPYAESASIDIGTIRNTIGTWARDVADRRGVDQPAGLAETMFWLADQIGWLRYQPFAGEAFDEWAYAARLVVFTVDRPMPRVDAGLCLAPLGDGDQRCQQRLSAGPRAAYVHCPACRTTFSILDRSAVVLEAAQDIRLGAEEAAHLLTLHGHTTPSSTIRSWAKRKRIIGDVYGRYRFGDVYRLRVGISRLAA